MSTFSKILLAVVRLVALAIIPVGVHAFGEEVRK